MVVYHIFSTQGIKNHVDLELARREICWLVKDRLIPRTPAGRGQKGFSFIRAQVEPISCDNRVNLPFGTFEKQILFDYKGVGVDNCTDIEEPAFVVPLKREINLSFIRKRLAFSTHITKVVDSLTKKPENFQCTKNFWLNTPNKTLLSHTNQSLADMAIFNIVHPYQEGLSFNIKTGRLTDINNGETLKPDSIHENRLKIASTIVPMELKNEKDKETSPEQLEKLVAKVASLSLPGYKMMTPIGSTGALSGANALFVLKYSDSEQDFANKRIADSVIKQLIELGDKHNMSLYLYLEHRTESKVYIVLKKHPRDSNLDYYGPAFNHAHEIRRLRQVEQIRNSHPGHKGPNGKRELVQKLTSGWSLKIIRPGFKDCEDFHVMIESPQEVVIDPYAGKKPNFETIFEEARRYLVCPHSAANWLTAVFNLWFAEENPEKIINRFTTNLQKCECMTDLRYAPDAFLWLIYYLFVEEDMNYRFWYHPPMRGLRYRKQGRDMPMNAILQIATAPFDTELPKETDKKTRSQDSLVKRPAVADFTSPEYLKEPLFKILSRT